MRQGGAAATLVVKNSNEVARRSASHDMTMHAHERTLPRFGLAGKPTRVFSARFLEKKFGKLNQERPNARKEIEVGFTRIVGSGAPLSIESGIHIITTV
jgi:hypothetical protein